jgi:glycosyltransferase involved in cell wall biosynthesis
MNCSILIPAFHSEDSIAETIQSVLQQSYADFEIVIAADDGKDYQAILNGQNILDKRIRHVSTGGVGTGVANARNTALKAVQGKFVVSLDADDRLHPDALKIMLPHAEKYGAAYSHMHYVDYKTRQMLPNYNRILPAGVKSLEEILTSNIHSYAWVVFDRQKHSQLKWMEDIIRWEDMLFFAACCEVLGGMYYLPEPLYIYSKRQGSICNRAETASEFRDWAGCIIALLEADRLGNISKAATIETLNRYFKSRFAIESAFEVSRLGWDEFMQQNIALFYQL